MWGRNMRSGGWIEQLEVVIDPRTDDGSDINETFVKQIASVSVPMGQASGRDFHVSLNMKNMIEQAGFVDVHEQTLKLPLGPWASDQKYKNVGRFYERFYKTGLQGWLLHICTRNMGVSLFCWHGQMTRTLTWSISGQWIRSTMPVSNAFRKSIRESISCIFLCECGLLQRIDGFADSKGRIIVVGRKP